MRERYDELSGAARSDGLRRLSRLTWRATQLGALATVGFAALFARTAPAATVASHPAPPKATVRPSSPAGSQAPSRAPRRHHARRHHHKPAGAAPAAPAPAPSPSLAPPTTAPAPPPPSPAPNPVHSTSTPSPGGGG